MAPSPLPPLSTALAQWTGEEVLVVGGKSLVDGTPAHNEVDAAYDPVLDR